MNFQKPKNVFYALNDFLYMISFVKRFINRCFWFYSTVIGEEDSYMVYYYSFSLLAGIVFIYLLVIFSVLNNYIHVAFFDFELKKYLVGFFLYLFLFMGFALVNRKNWEKKILEPIDKNWILDSFIFFIVLGGLVSLFWVYGVI